jgi:adenosylmethionine-8-amino-7-oxononanoate aminotransferase
MNDNKVYAIPRNLTSTCPTLVKGKGIYLYDDQGKQYIDGSSGSSLVSNIGHGIHEVAQVMKAQAAEIAYNPTHCSVSQPFLDLSKKIADLAPGRLNISFVVNGGSEATESALKFGRQFQIERGMPTKFEVISRWQSYHGNTIGALSVSRH